MSSRFERLESRTVFEGTMIDVCEGTFRHEDGGEVTRQWVAAGHSVGVVAHDSRQVWLVRQPREAIGEPDLLEIPAGRLDVEGESPLECAQRELREEIGKAADEWEHLITFFTSPGIMGEQCHVYRATGLHDDDDAEADSHERIHVVTRALDELDDVIAGCRDSKTLIGLYRLRDRI